MPEKNCVMKCSIKNKDLNDNRTTMIKEIIVTSIDKTKFVGIIVQN